MNTMQSAGTRESEIPRAVANLNAAKDLLTNRIVDLISRLNPVMREPGPPSPVQPEAAKCLASACPTTPLGESLRSVERSIHDLSDRLDDVLSRIEL